jgi:hypothetical protein
MLGGIMNTDKTLRVRMTTRQYERLVEMASTYGMITVSDYVRMMTDYFEQHRPTIVMQPRPVERAKEPA